MDEIEFGRYRLIGPLDTAAPNLLRAKDTLIGRDVAIKVLPTELGAKLENRERFLREAHIAARLTEPHIIPVHDVGDVDGQLYLVMPLIVGTDLQTLLTREGAIEPYRAVHVVEGLAAALDAVHESGLVHADVRPSKTFVTGDDFAYLIDVGAARDASDGTVDSGIFSPACAIAGAHAYMAPERLMTGTADVRTDVYSLACLLYRCLTSSVPYPGDSVEMQIGGHLALDPPNPSKANPAVPAGFGDVIARGLAKNPDDRYQSTGELSAAARRVLTELTHTTTASWADSATSAKGPPQSPAVNAAEPRTPARSAGDLAEGPHFGHYHLKRLIYSGGMGQVYEAEDTRKGRVVALKLLPADRSRDPLWRKLFHRGTRSAARLQNPHVVPIHDYGEIDGVLYVEMRLIDGTDLQTMLRRYGWLNPARSVAIIGQVASALDAAHAEGIMHSDVKPENILITRDDFAYLVDFGIASAVTDEKLSELSDSTIVGTWAYLAPEKLSFADVTYRVDIYALACVLYECLTGKQPYGEDNLGSFVHAHLTKPIPRPSEARPGVPKEFDEVIARGMAKNPGDRYTSAGELAMAARRAVISADRVFEHVEAAPLPPPPMAMPADAAPARGRTTTAGTAWVPQLAGGAPAAPPGWAPPSITGVSVLAQTIPPQAAGDRLTSTVFAPSAVESGQMFLVQVFAHLPEHGMQVSDLAREFDEDAQRRGFVELDSRVMEGERLTFELLLSALEVDDPVQSMVWTGSPQSVQFAVSVPPDLSRRAVIGTVTVSRDLVPIGHLKFKVTVCDGGKSVAHTEIHPGMHRYSRAFISYASPDRKEVLKRAQMLDDVGIDFFQDILSLKPGRRWERTIYSEIDCCDLFLLFWSSAAKKSPWVQKEVRYALKRNGGDELAPPEILPVVIEGPPVAPPPDELAHLHFNDRMIYFIEATPTDGSGVDGDDQIAVGEDVEAKN